MALSAIQIQEVLAKKDVKRLSEIIAVRHAQYFYTVAKETDENTDARLYVDKTYNLSNAVIAGDATRLNTVFRMCVFVLSTTFDPDDIDQELSAWEISLSNAIADAFNLAAAIRKEEATAYNALP